MQEASVKGRCLGNVFTSNFRRALKMNSDHDPDLNRFRPASGIINSLDYMGVISKICAMCARKSFNLSCFVDPGTDLV